MCTRTDHDGACEDCARTDTWLDLLTEIRDRLPNVTIAYDAPASTETARNGDLSDDGADQAPVHPPTRERPPAGDSDEALAMVIRDGVGKPSTSDAEMWATAARAAREHILGGPDDEPMGVYRRRDVEAHRERAEKAEAERDEWRAKHAALRAAVQVTLAQAWTPPRHLARNPGDDPKETR